MLGVGSPVAEPGSEVSDVITDSGQELTSDEPEVSDAFGEGEDAVMGVPEALVHLIEERGELAVPEVAGHLIQ